MDLILYIETSELLCSVAISDGNQLIGVKESVTDRAHAKALTVLINELLFEKGLEMRHLKAVSVSKGPGSYTGLRIGVSVAKGICYALNIPLIAIDTLLALSYGIKAKIALNDDILLCPMIDARRMEVYKAIYDTNFTLIEPVKAEIIEKHTFDKLLEKNKIAFFGSGALKCQSIIEHSNAIFYNNIVPRAEFLVIPSYNKYNNRQFENVAYFEPFYLKDFVASTPRNKNLR
jgi:tRNA threonylcarbamoyladenosine biosynthesis protein TsaB